MTAPRGRWATCWHPDSPGVRVRVWVPWFRKPRFFATARQMRSKRHPMTYESGLPWLPLIHHGVDPR